jgi:hypothetical protein
MTLHARCPTNGSQIDFGFQVYSQEQPQPPVARGEARGTRLASGEVRVHVTECPSCGRVHQLIVAADATNAS